MKINQFLVGVAVGVVVLGLMATPALASNSGDGSDYGSMPGYGVATSHTSCADHGSFNAFGKNASLGIAKVHATFLRSYPGPGTNGTQTGINNSTLCGQPHN